MTISKRDTKLLLCLAGIVIFLLFYLLGYNHFNDLRDETEAATAALMPELEELRGYKANEEQYRIGIEDSNAVIEELSVRYPNDVRSEDQIMFASNMEKQVGLSVTSASFSEAVALLDFSGVSEQEDGSHQAIPLHAFSKGMSMSCSMTYPELKRALGYLYEQNNITALDSLTVSYDSATGELFGSMNIQNYYITGADDAYYPTQTPSFPTGTSNIFGTVTTAPNPAP